MNIETTYVERHSARLAMAQEMSSATMAELVAELLPRFSSAGPLADIPGYRGQQSPARERTRRAVLMAIAMKRGWGHGHAVFNLEECLQEWATCCGGPATALEDRLLHDRVRDTVNVFYPGAFAPETFDRVYRRVADMATLANELRRAEAEIESESPYWTGIEPIPTPAPASVEELPPARGRFDIMAS